MAKEDKATVEATGDESAATAAEELWLDDDEDSAAPDPDIEDDPEPESQPPAKDPAAAPAAEKPAEEDKPKWDKDRQKRDQERADRERARHEEMMAALRTLNEKVAGLNRTAGDDGPAKDKPLAEDELEKLDDTADATAIVGAVKRLHAAVNRLDERITEQQQRQGELASREATRDSKALLNEMLTQLDKQYGAKHRTAALAAVRERLKQDGFSRDNPPDNATTRYALQLAYQDVAAKEKPKPAPKGDGLILDPATGGTTADGLKCGTRKEVLAAMRREGKLK